jgi:hypothetical protein
VLGRRGAIMGSDAPKFNEAGDLRVVLNRR